MILQVADFPPSAVFTVMVAVPFFFAVTKPVLLAVATVVLLLVQVTALLVAFEGCGHAASWKVFPPRIVFDVVLIFTPLTGIPTVILQVAVFPLEVFAVMLVVPFALAVTFPFETVATLMLLLDHVTVLFVALDGETVAVIV